MNQREEVAKGRKNIILLHEEKNGVRVCVNLRA
jgi:hypothetical protein